MGSQQEPVALGSNSAACGPGTKGEGEELADVDIPAENYERRPGNQSALLVDRWGGAGISGGEIARKLSYSDAREVDGSRVLRQLEHQEGGEAKKVNR
jgi:hypothetical protein